VYLEPTYVYSIQAGNVAERAGSDVKLMTNLLKTPVCNSPLCHQLIIHEDTTTVQPCVTQNTHVIVSNCPTKSGNFCL